MNIEDLLDIEHDKLSEIYLKQKELLEEGVDFNNKNFLRKFIVITNPISMRVNISPLGRFVLFPGDTVLISNGTKFKTLDITHSSLLLGAALSLMDKNVKKQDFSLSLIADGNERKIQEEKDAIGDLPRLKEILSRPMFQKKSKIKSADLSETYRAAFACFNLDSYRKDVLELRKKYGIK